MHPIMLAAEGADATPYIISGLAACVTALFGIVATIALAKSASVTHKLDEETKERHKLAIVSERHEGEIKTLKAKADGALLEKVFETRMTYQDRVLNEQTGMLKRHDERLAAIGEDLVSHDEQLRKRSQTAMQAARPVARPPIPRTDGPSETLPSEPPPMRGKLKSQQFR